MGFQKKEFEANMQNDYRDGWAELLSGGPDKRECLYKFFETEEMRPRFKGPEGCQYYAEIMEIATKAGAPADEVRERLVPLLDKEHFEVFANQLMKNFMKNGGLNRALEKVAEKRKADAQARTQELLRRHEEAVVLIESEKKKRGWLGRLFS
jgi:hypothetical protein